MLGLVALVGGLFAFLGSVVVAGVTVALLLAFLIPLLIFGLVFRIGFALMRFAALLVLLCFVAVWLV